jgi:hypothetical protein
MTSKYPDSQAVLDVSELCDECLTKLRRGKPADPKVDWMTWREVELERKVRLITSLIRKNEDAEFAARQSIHRAEEKITESNRVNDGIHNAFSERVAVLTQQRNIIALLFAIFLFLWFVFNCCQGQAALAC